eukprot:1668636-Rhodomonas_salina.1
MEREEGWSGGVDDAQAGANGVTDQPECVARTLGIPEPQAASANSAHDWRFNFKFEIWWSSRVGAQRHRVFRHTRGTNSTEICIGPRHSQVTNQSSASASSHVGLLFSRIDTAAHARAPSSEMLPRGQLQ